MTHHSLLLHVLVRWLDSIALVTLVGGLSYRLFVLYPMRRDPRDLKDRPQRYLLIVPVCVLVATGLTDLVLRALMISGRPLSELASILPTVLSQTHFGRVWTWRFVLLPLFFGFWFLENRRPRTAAPVAVSLGAAAGVCLTTSLTGHAADLGILRFPVLSDWVHLIAVSSWVGGLFALRLHFSLWLARSTGNARAEYLAEGITRFSIVAMSAVGALLLTGLYNTLAHVESAALLVGTSYGRILIVKWLLLAPMLALGATNRYGILPQLRALSGRTEKGRLARVLAPWVSPLLPNTTGLDLERRFFRLIAIEAVLGVAVLACSAWLTQLPPPHQNALFSPPPSHHSHAG